MFTKPTALILVCISLILTLCACSQPRVNGERLPNNDNMENIGSSDQEEEDYGSDYTLGKYNEAEKAFQIDDYYGAGRINFYVNDVKTADSMEGAGIDSVKYQLSGSRTYDYYVAVSLTIENVDVPVNDDAMGSESVKFSFINEFCMYIGSDIAIEPAYFDQGGVANPDPKRYFQYELPSMGETLDVVIAFGMTDHEKNEPLFLSYDYVSGMMPIEGVF